MGLQSPTRPAERRPCRRVGVVDDLGLLPAMPRANHSSDRETNDAPRHRLWGGVKEIGAYVRQHAATYAATARRSRPVF